MRIGLLEIGIGLAIVYAVTRPKASKGTGNGLLLEGTPSGGGGGGGSVPGFLGGLGGTGVGKMPAPPKNTPFKWTSGSCLPIIQKVEQTIAWSRDFGKSAPKNLTPDQYTEFAIRTAMGSCYPPPADPVATWGAGKVPYWWDYYRAYLQGLKNGKRLSEAAVQQMLNQAMAWLVARGVDTSLLDPWVFSKA